MPSCQVKQIILFLRVHNGLYSINSLRQRPFLSNGAHLAVPVEVVDGWEKPELRCTTIGCTPPTPTVVPKTTIDNELAIACIGKVLNVIFTKVS